WREANVHAFTVAKATSLEVLRTIRAEVAKSIGEGQTFEAFKKALRPRLEDLGWWGRQEVLDGDTGELTQVQLGSNRRLRTIYQTNVQTAYMAGRFKRFMDNVGDRPYWRYVAVMDGRTRPAHAALHGRVWRFDDPIWEVIWPPNGWGCRCRVVALTQAEFELLGVELESGADAIVELQVPVGRDGATVAVQGVRYRDALGKEKVFRPDPGWDYNPGAEWARFDPNGFAGEQAPVAPVTPATPTVVRALDGLPTWRDFGRPDLREIDPAWRLPDPGMLPKAPSRQLAQQMLFDVLLPGGQAVRQIATPVETVAVRRELLPHVVEKEEDGRERYANFILPTLQQPFEVWLTPYDDGTYRKRYIGLFQAKNDLLVIVRENRDGSLFWEVYNMMQRDKRQLNQLRVGTLLFGEVGR
ncbi:MAG: minor capsid protein, partial [Burkholderiaceae bacterium]|nr:minor capsid protein [Burkholderiaceae bacterium]